MRNYLSFLFAIIFSVPVFSQIAKKVVVEHFTNTRCSICASRNPGFYSNLSNHPDILHISFHPSAPYSNCALNNHNSQENDDRTKYYGQYGSTPKFTIQGDNIPSSQNVNSPSLFTPFTGQNTEASINVSHVKHADDSIQVFVSVKTEASHSYGNLRLFVGLAEDTVFYNAPNGESEHYDVFRKSLSDIEGDVVNLPSNVGDSISFSFSANKHVDWNFSRIYAMVILQEESSKDVLQASASMSDPSGSPVGVIELEQEAPLVYPNPVSDIFNVSFPNKIQSMKLYSITGKVMYAETNFNNELVSIDVSNYNRGLYFLEVLVDGQKYISKVQID